MNSLVVFVGGTATAEARYPGNPSKWENNDINQDVDARVKLDQENESPADLSINPHPRAKQIMNVGETILVD